MGANATANIFVEHESEENFMATYAFVEFHIPEASKLADLTGIRHDLESARTLATELKVLLEDLLQHGKANSNILDALTTATLIRYFRPFSKGIRRRLDISEIGTITPLLHKKHEHLRAFRNKYLAHSVNAYEQNRPVARYVEERMDTEGVNAVECHHTRVIAMSPQEVDDAIELTTCILRYLDDIIETEKKHVLEKIRLVPIRELLSKEKGLTYDPRKVDINKTRSK